MFKVIKMIEIDFKTLDYVCIKHALFIQAVCSQLLWQMLSDSS